MLGSAQAPAFGTRHVFAYLVGMDGLAFCIGLIWLSMRAVLDIGGACASGGPYVPQVECPDVVIAAMPLSILGGFVVAGLALWGGAAIGGGWAGLILLAWPALFISLGWNFLEYGFVPPGGAEGWVWSSIFCGVIFVAMGALPLLLVVWGVTEASGGGRELARGRVVVRSRPSAPPAEPVVDRLDRLASLRARGDLTDEEVEAAKRATLAEAGEIGR